MKDIGAVVVVLVVDGWGKLDKVEKVKDTG